MSSQMDNRSQSAGKRARTDGSRREDDWVCPSCRNINFAFRTTCNMRNCDQPRPAEYTAMQTPPHYSVPARYMAPGTPPSMYLGAAPPQYAPSLYNGHAMPRYGIPQLSPGSGYQYGYGARLPMGSPYGPPVHMTGPPQYSAGPMIGGGGMYSISMPIDRYGLGSPGGPGAMVITPVTRAGSYSEEGSQKKSAGAGRDNDWKCPNCNNVNFAFRAVCNMRKCNTPRPDNQGPKPDSSRGSKPKTPEGSWKCDKCNNINYPFRTKCNRPTCGEEKPLQANSPDDLATDQDNQFLSCNIAMLLSKLQLSHDFEDSSSALTKKDLPRRADGLPLPTSSYALRMAALSELRGSFMN
ncbi:ranBP2-type zinc finger protein At1g67325-like isoform X1 [Lolium rigidum]|uniref:ranBP2-type zinc finger protein At1g67325-like isoform X1 n=2 Tax=Lolium rigidum TaxID=89674 RepID=UPI001F5D2AD5|nr:ranBP2-type zinc finger protein At1g67325-like isoform X1 [Lolium rigidum]